MRKRITSAYLIGLTGVIFIVLILNNEHNRNWLSPGEITPGHEKLSCKKCHIESNAKIRQQIQANVQFLVGNRKNSVSFNRDPVGNEVCLKCHNREEDNHPVYRFNEPKYREIRRKIQAQFCITCHREHHGIRVSAEIGFCKPCHEDMKLKKDSLDITHKELIAQKRWKTCMRCHDFHGNHLMKVANNTNRMLELNAVVAYMKSGLDPYSKEKKYKARESSDAR